MNADDLRELQRQFARASINGDEVEKARLRRLILELSEKLGPIS